MRLKDKTLPEIIDENLWWRDFEEDPKKILEVAEGDRAALDKIAFLDQQENGDLLNASSLRKLDIYEVSFTALARLAVAGGEYVAEGDESRGEEVDYLKDYSGLNLLIEDMGDIYALYLKDYEFGYVKPLGLLELSSDRQELDEQARMEFVRENVLPEIELRMWDEEFDLAGELFNYYHVIPDTVNSLVSQRVNLAGLVSVKEAASQLDVSDARVKKMVADQLLDGYKYGDKLLISQSSIDKRVEFIEKHGKPTRGKKRTSWVERYQAQGGFAD